MQSKAKLSLTPPEHFLGDGHLEHIAREGHPRVAVVDPRSALKHLDYSSAAEHFKNLRTVTLQHWFGPPNKKKAGRQKEKAHERGRGQKKKRVTGRAAEWRNIYVVGGRRLLEVVSRKAERMSIARLLCLLEQVKNQAGKDRR